MCIQGTSAHFDVVTGREGLKGDGVHVDGVALAEVESVAESVSGACIADDEVLVAPFLTQDLSQGVVVRDCGDAVVSGDTDVIKLSIDLRKWLTSDMRS